VSSVLTKLGSSTVVGCGELWGNHVKPCDTVPGGITGQTEIAMFPLQRSQGSCNIFVLSLGLHVTRDIYFKLYFLFKCSVTFCSPEIKKKQQIEFKHAFKDFSNIPDMSELNEITLINTKYVVLLYRVYLISLCLPFYFHLSLFRNIHEEEGKLQDFWPSLSIIIATNSKKVK
jgi:hypothetical protein